MKKEEWTVKAYGVTYKDGKRIERPLEDFTPEELEEITRRKNAEALAAAGYRPVASKPAIA